VLFTKPKHNPEKQTTQKNSKTRLVWFSLFLICLLSRINASVYTDVNGTV